MDKRVLIFFVVIIFIATAFWYGKTSTSPNTANPIQTVTSTITSGEKILDLSSRGLEKLPADVLNKSELEELNISNNKITGALPAEIRNLRNLRVLNASDNLMTGVPAEVGQLQNLETLDLSNNKLTGLPYEIGNLKKLKKLNLSGNDYSKQDLEVIKKSLSPSVEIII